MSPGRSALLAAACRTDHGRVQRRQLHARGRSDPAREALRPSGACVRRDAARGRDGRRRHRRPPRRDLH
jgi:hypothetical protein